MVWYAHLFQNFPQFIVTHTVKGFGIVNKAEIDVFLELSRFFDDPADVGKLTSGSTAFSKTSLIIWKFMVHVLLKPGLEIEYLIILVHFGEKVILFAIELLLYLSQILAIYIYGSEFSISLMCLS